MKGTGRWFIESNEFSCWKAGLKRSLWLHGIPGAGKMVLCSTIIDEIYSLQSDIECVYFDFDFNDTQKQSIDGFLRSILLQICSSRNDFVTHAEPLFEKCIHGTQRPSPDALVETLHTLLKGHRRIYLVLDALDECTEWMQMSELLKKLISSHGNLNVLLTSRLEQDIKIMLLDHIEIILSIQSDEVKGDVELYVRKTA